jgi:uncharacterized glyoxalase superfamily protein PhnB
VAKLLGITPYLHYEDAGDMLDWLAKAFGFVEIARYQDANGLVQEAEMRIGEQELWMAGHAAGYWAQKGAGPEQLLLVWVDDVDAHHAQLTAAGVQAPAPADKPYGVRTYEVTDPQGYRWGFMQRLDTPVQLQDGWQEVKPSP